MISIRMILMISALLLGHLGPASAQSTDSKAALGALKLTSSQKSKIGAVVSGTQKRTIRLTADMEIAGLDLRDELSKESASEAKVGKLIEKISSLEGELRKNKVLTWMRIRKLLDVDQRKKLDAIKPLRSVSSRSSKRTTSDARNIITPFDDATDAVAAPCDEVTCLVHPERACCRRYKGNAPGGNSNNANLPERPARSEITAGIARVRPQVTSCGETYGFQGTVRVKMKIEDDGKVRIAATTGGSKEFRFCVTSAVKRARFSKSLKGSTVTYPFVFR